MSPGRAAEGREPRWKVLYRRHLLPHDRQEAQHAAASVLLLMFVSFCTWLGLAYLVAGSLNQLTQMPMNPTQTRFVAFGMPASLLISGVLMRRTTVPASMLGLPFVAFFVTVGLFGAMSGQVNGAGSQAPNILVAIYATFHLPRVAAWLTSALCIASGVVNNAVLSPDSAGISNALLVALVFVSTTAVITQVRAAHDAVAARLRRRLDVDALTGAATRHVLEERLTGCGAECEMGEGVALILADADHLKRVNDTHGHPAGDQLLRHVCDAITGVVPSRAVVARLGGDEFAVLVPDVSPAAAETLARAILVSITSTPLTISGGPTMHASASLGLGHVDDPTQVDGLYQQADRALYAAKGAGRGCLATPLGTVFTPPGPDACAITGVIPEQRGGADDVSRSADERRGDERRGDDHGGQHGTRHDSDGVGAQPQ